MTTREEILIAINRNKKRLLKEIRESKELMQLLTKSVTKPLTEEEKQKVKEQLLDVCKAIPAFAVFMLPGGSILLPLLIKLIPSILPSSFREDLPEDNIEDTSE